MTWQRRNIIRAVEYLARLESAGAEDPETVETLRGLREVLDPKLRDFRLRAMRELGQIDAAGYETRED